MFNLIAESRAHLSQHGDQTSLKSPDLASALASITKPKITQKLRMGIWSEDVLVGSINLTPDEEDGFSAEIGYYLGEAHTGKGYMTMSVKALAEYAIQILGFTRLYAEIKTANIASQLVIEACGFVMDGLNEDRTHIVFEYDS